MDQFDVVAEVGGVRADPAAGGAPQDQGGGGGVAVRGLVTATSIIMVTAMVIPAYRRGRLI